MSNTLVQERREYFFEGLEESYRKYQSGKRVYKYGLYLFDFLNSHPKTKSETQ